jgi:hypothetical protein
MALVDAMVAKIRHPDAHFLMRGNHEVSWRTARGPGAPFRGRGWVKASVQSGKGRHQISRMIRQGKRAVFAHGCRRPAWKICLPATPPADLVYMDACGTHSAAGGTAGRVTDSHALVVCCPALLYPC